MAAERKPLIIAEKPSAARAIAEALGGFSRREGYLESPEYTLSWAIGHLVELMSPEEYDARWKRWSLESLPIMPDYFGLKVVSKTKSQFDVLRRLAAQAPALINACDAAREGELIFRYICQAGGLKQPVRRLWVSSLTRESIRRGFASLRPDSEYDRLYRSALCRAQGDWLMGMNATRAFTVKWGELFSVGRVQTPTLALLVRREREIKSFVAEQYWEVLADFATPDGRRYRGKWVGKENESRLKKADEAEAIAARVKGQPGQVESVEEKPVSERPPLLYDLTTLQRDANRRFGLTAAGTLKAAQSLYEAKLITYPRTDSRYLNRDLVKGLPSVVRVLEEVAEFRQAAAGADLSLVHPGNRRVVDDTKVTDHHAIIPTTENPSGLSGVEAKVYGLIARRFLAQFYPDARFMETEVFTTAGSVPDRFRSKGRRMLEAGWRAVEPEPPAKKGEEEEVPALPSLTAGEPVKARSAEAVKKETQPPKRFSEASLLGAMETAGKGMEDEALREAMKGRGLGTPATRASIIERLKDVGYITLEKKTLMPTTKGHRLVDLAEAAGATLLLSAELTGEWEKRIADIQGGAYDPDRFMAEIREQAKQVVALTRQAGGAPAGDGSAAAPPTAGAGRGRRRSTEPAASTDGPLSAGKCPQCSRAVIRGSKDWVCVNADCVVRIPTWLCSKVIDQPLASALLTTGRTKLITGFKSPRTGTTFSAFLRLVGGKVEFEFPPDKPKKASGYRRSGERGNTGESAAAAKTGSRKAGSSAGTGAAKSKRAAGTGVGRRTSGASKPARTGPDAD